MPKGCQSTKRPIIRFALALTSRPGLDERHPLRAQLLALDTINTRSE